MPSTTTSRPRSQGERLAALAVTLTLHARVGEPLVFDLPSQVASDRAGAALAVDGADALASAAGAVADDKWRLRATSTTVTLRYRLRSDGSDSPLADQDNPQRNPAVRNRWFCVKGEQALAMPEGRERDAATLDLDDVPAGWTATTSLAGPATVADVADSLVIGGRDYRLMQRQVGGATLRLAYPEALKATAADLLDASAKVLAAEWRFWRAPAQPFYRPGADE